MTEKTRQLLELRKEKKKRQPEFVRQDAHKHKGGRIRWRKPRGLQSKVRLEKRGYKKKVKNGYRTPVILRGTDRNGRRMRRIESLKDIDAMSRDEMGIVQRMGMRAKKEIVESALKKGLTLLNGGESFLKKVESCIRERKSIPKKAKLAARKELKEKVKKAEKESEEDRKKSEKEAKDKLLTKRT